MNLFAMNILSASSYQLRDLSEETNVIKLFLAFTHFLVVSGRVPHFHSGVILL
jgi:hypothetical protein